MFYLSIETLQHIGALVNLADLSPKCVMLSNEANDDYRGVCGGGGGGRGGGEEERKKSGVFRWQKLQSRSCSSTQLKLRDWVSLGAIN